MLYIYINMLGILSNRFDLYGNCNRSNGNIIFLTTYVLVQFELEFIAIVLSYTIWCYIIFMNINPPWSQSRYFGSLNCSLIATRRQNANFFFMCKHPLLFTHKRYFSGLQSNFRILTHNISNFLCATSYQLWT